MADNCTGLRQLDPVQGLVDYVQDIKPYHSKVIEVLIEYVNEDFIDVTIGEQSEWDITIEKKADELSYSVCNPGYQFPFYGGSSAYPIISPNQTEDVFGDFTYGFQQNSFSVPGDQTTIFRSNDSVNVRAYIEDYSNLHNIVDVTLGTAGNASFVISGDQTSSFTSGDNFYVIGAAREKNFVVNNISYNGSTNTTTIVVNQSISNVDVGKHLGLTRIIDTNNSGTFAITQVVYNGGSIDSWPDITDPFSYELGNDPHTLISVNHAFTTPSVTSQQTYAATAHTSGVQIEDVFAYSNIKLSMGQQNPDEGSVFEQVVDFTTSTVTINGNYQVSNLTKDDTLTITQSSQNNGTYIITSIVYNQNGTTTFELQQPLDDSVVDGYVHLFIPSNMFVVDGNFQSRFSQGTLFDVTGGSLEGTYTVLYSDYVNGKTRIRPIEPIFRIGTGSLIVQSTSNNQFIISGDNTAQFTQGQTFTVVNSNGNDGSYVVASPGSTFDPQQGTIIPVASDVPFVQTSAEGELFATTFGFIKLHIAGYGQESKLHCASPDTFVDINIDEYLQFEGLGLDLSDDVIAYNLENTDTWGFDLPLLTILASTEPAVPEQPTAPSNPDLADLWFDTSTNIFRQFSGGYWKPITTAYWLDTDSNIFHYRTKNKNIDTGWVVYFFQSPQFSAVIPANSDQNTNAFVNGYSIEPHTVYHQYVTVDTTNDFYVLSGGNWAERFYINFVFNCYNIGSSPTSGDLGSWTVPSYTIQSVDSNNFIVDGDVTSLFTQDRIMYVKRAKSSVHPFTVDSSSYDGSSNQTIITPQQTIPVDPLALENPIPVLEIDSGSDEIRVEGDVSDRYSNGSIVVIGGSTANNNGEWTVSGTSYNSGTNVTSIQISGIFIDADTSASVTIQTYVSQVYNDDYLLIFGAVYEEDVTGSGPYDTGQPKTIVSVNSSVDANAEAISYVWTGPIQLDIAEHPTTVLRVSPNDKLYLDGEIFETVSSFDIIDTDLTANTIQVQYVDPQTGLDVDLSTKYPSGTIVTIRGSYGDGNPASLETNDAKYVVKSSTFDSNTGITSITIEDDFLQIPPYNSFTVMGATNTSGSIPGTITLSGNHVKVFDSIEQSEQFRLDQPLVSSNQFTNIITVTNAEFNSSTNETVLSVTEELIDTTYTGLINVIRAEYRANIEYDQTNTTSPWEDGLLQLGVTPIDENVTEATIIDDIMFGWGGTEQWIIVSTDQSTSTITIDGDQTSILDINDQVKIIGSDGNDGQYQIQAITFDGGNNQTDVVVYNPMLLVDPSAGLEGYLQIDAIDITSWFQYLIREANSTTNTFTLYGDATNDIQSGQSISVFGTQNDGTYVVSGTPTLDTQLFVTEVPVNNIEFDQNGGWIQSYRDMGMMIILEDSIGVSIAEVSDAAVLTTAGSMIGSWDYNYFDVGSFDESLGTVIHLYSNTF